MARPPRTLQDVQTATEQEFDQAFRQTKGSRKQATDQAMDLFYDQAEDIPDLDDLDAAGEDMKTSLAVRQPAQAAPPPIKQAPKSGPPRPHPAPQSGSPPSSPYRFVELNKDIVPSPAVAEGIRLDRPHPKGISGCVTVRWHAETPFLIGEQGHGADNAPVAPLNIDGRPVIPGATLRGALRAVLEIAAHARLGRFNGDLQFGWRDFQDPYYKQRLLTEDRDVIRAGWLSRGADGRYSIHECTWHKVPLSDVAKACNVSDLKYWRTTLGLDQKMPKLDKAGLLDGEAWFTPDAGKGRCATLTPRRGQRGTVVVADHAPTRNGDNDKFNRKWEYLFAAPTGSTHLLPDGTVARFDRLNSTPSARRPKPNGAWAYWRPKLIAGQAVPVFFVDDGDGGIHFGLTRLFRIPQRHTPGNLLKQNHPHHLKAPGDAPDFVEALFGYVDEPPPGTTERQAPATLARRGRVAFGLAWCDQDAQTAQTRLRDKETVLLAPRPSFFPYYVPQSTQGYMDDPAPPLAGRKRYPVAPERDWTGADENNDKIRAESNDKIRNTLRVLDPAKGAVSFTGTIQAHNLLPEELGGLLWALTFGVLENSPYRHAIGRGKPLGLGRMRPEIIDWRMESHATGKEVPQQDSLTAFTAYMDRQAPGWSASRSLAEVRAMADPKVGAQRRAELNYPGNFKAYAEIKKNGQRLRPYP